MRGPVLVSVFVLAVLTGCGSSPSRPAPAPRPAIQVSATLVSPNDITVRWKDPGRGVAGHIVEFATSPRGPYTILQFLPPRVATYTHPDLMPQTPFYYRVRPYYGPVSSSVDIALPRRPEGPKAARSVGAAATYSIRGDGSGGIPTDLKGIVTAADTIRFTWTDHAGDEDGYLLEVRPAGRRDVEVVAALDPNVTLFDLVTLPEEKSASYRVRAFYYGTASNIAHQRTRGTPD